MNSTHISTATIRQRGQLTIPETLRKSLGWLSVGSIVSIMVSSQEQVTVIPYPGQERAQVDWKKIWNQIRLARSFRGKRGNLAQFIMEDREHH